MRVTRLLQQVSRHGSGFSRFVSTRSINLKPALFPTLAIGTGVLCGSSYLLAEEPAVDYDAIRRDIEEIMESDENHDDGSFGPIFVRLAWHNSGTFCKASGNGGSAGARMRFEPECKWDANAGLHIARNVLEKVKEKHPGISYSDLWTFAACIAIEEMGGPKIPWRPGRVDAVDGSDTVPDGRLPDGDKGAAHLRHIFYKMGFNDQEIVALAGAHTLGRCHPEASGWDGPWGRSPITFSNMYFKELFENTWTLKKWDGPPQFEDPTGELMMLPSDMCIIKDPSFRKWADIYYRDEERFFKDFTAAFTKLTELGCKFNEEDSFTPFLFIAGLVGFALHKGL